MVDFPLKFESKASSASGISNNWQCSVNNLDPITVAIPVEFHGTGKGYTPEDLFGLAILNCIIAVYKSLCEKNSVEFEKIEGFVTVIMDKKRENSHLEVPNLEIKLIVTGANDKEKAKTFLEKAIKDCPVSNSIKSGKTYHLEVN